MSEVPPAVSPARTPEEVRRALAEQIGSGRLRPGQRLGAERALAAEFGVSRATLRQALAVLEEGGVVRRVPGRGGGTFVAKGKIERDLSRIVGVPALLRSQGVVAGTRVLSARLAEADDITAQALRAPALPVGWVLKSSGCAWTIRPRPMMLAGPELTVTTSTSAVSSALPLASDLRLGRSPAWCSGMLCAPCGLP